MQSQLINEDYLSGLLSLSQDQDDPGFVNQLFDNLRSEYALFRQDCAPWVYAPTNKTEFQQRIHRLKNNFFNLGCEEAGHALESMYQELKAERPLPERLAPMWKNFEVSANKTIQQLSLTLHH